MILLPLSLLAFIIGMSNGVCDSIRSHDGSKEFGYRWSNQSWRLYYDEDRTWLERLMGASINVWHCFDWLRNLASLAAIIIAGVFGFEIMFQMLIIPAMFQFGFWLFYT